MSSTTVLILAFAIGAFAGLRAMTAPAVTSWAARLGWLNLQNSWLAFLGFAVTPYIITVFALAELVNDKRPTTPSRKTPGPFGARIVMGGLCGACLCISANQSAVVGAIVGALGGVVGTLGGYEVRTRLVKALKVPDIVIALIEDAIAAGGGFFFVSRF
jgi:uncharacterized membrane protein